MRIHENRLEGNDLVEMQYGTLTNSLGNFFRLLYQAGSRLAGRQLGSLGSKVDEVGGYVGAAPIRDPKP